MHRRDILKYTALATGAAISAPIATSVLSGCTTQVQETTGNITAFFNKKEKDLIIKIIDTILPKTESPSASEVGVHNIIDNMVGQVYNEEDRLSYKTNFDLLRSSLEKDDFNSLKTEDRITALLKFENKDQEVSEETRQAYIDLKNQTIAYYLSTEDVSINFLNYLPVPGDYQACIPLTEIGGKAWAI